MRALGEKHQVLCVTHLPQIAAMADQHYLIRKEERGGRTYTDVFALDREGRRQELARLHGGDHITETTLASAEEQLLACERFKAETTA
jgi:DNA repair protein RecN (Recombination protein N)